MVKRLTRSQFQDFPHSPRPLMYRYLVEEREWYADDAESTLGVLFLDREDGDWAYVVFQPDPDGVFTWAAGAHSFAFQETARQKLLDDIERVAEDRLTTGVPQALPNLARAIGPADPFIPIVAEPKLNPLFRVVATMPNHSPAKGIIREIFRDYTDRDGNFVEQFQTTGFDARIWELYLHTYFTDCAFQLLPTTSPDFLVAKSGCEIAIEAVTANQTQGKGNPVQSSAKSSVNLLTPPFDRTFPLLNEPFDYKQEDFVPIKLGSALYSKLKKKYWELPSTKDIPLIFAIEAFHEQASLHYTSSALSTYLYGTRYSYVWDHEGKLVIIPQKIQKHSFGGKTIDSGFFDLPESEHVSAVLFSNSGTVSKFNRMGQQGAFYNPNLILFRFGGCVDPDPQAVRPAGFHYQVGDPEWMEWWGQGLDMFHNPRALHPVDPNMFPDIAHHRFEDGYIFTQGPEFQPFNSVTFNLVRSSAGSMEEPLALMKAM